MAVKVIAWVVGGCDEGNVEGVHQGSRAEVGLSDVLSDGVIDVISGLDAGALGDTKNADELVNQPVTHCSTCKVAPVFAEDSEGLPVVLLTHRLSNDTKVLEIDTIGMQQAIHVMVGGDEQARRVGEGQVISDP